MSAPYGRQHQGVFPDGRWQGMMSSLVSGSGSSLATLGAGKWEMDHLRFCDRR